MPALSNGVEDIGDLHREYSQPKYSSGLRFDFVSAQTYEKSMNSPRPFSWSSQYSTLLLMQRLTHLIGFI
jgi:hypothetical protein